MPYHFYALIARMRHIARWGLMRNTQPENLQEHSFVTAVLAHALALIRREILHLPSADPARAAEAALFHDAAEIYTGDLPTPVKYFDPEIRAAYQRVETSACAQLLSLLPEALHAHYRPLVSESGENELLLTVRAADKLAAYLKCLEELRAGNDEFARAARQSLDKLQAMRRPEVDWFLTHCAPSFGLSLDVLTDD